MLTTKQFIEAAQAGTIDLTKVWVIVDNDCTDAYAPKADDAEDEECICRFDGHGPEGSLIAVLQALGINAERP